MSCGWAKDYDEKHKPSRLHEQEVKRLPVRIKAEGRIGGHENVRSQ